MFCFIPFKGAYGGRICNVVHILWWQDVLELLEKRVKSRFSHRQLHLLPVFGYDTYVHIFKATLKLPDSFGHPKFVASWNAQIDVRYSWDSFELSTH